MSAHKWRRRMTFAAVAAIAVVGTAFGAQGTAIAQFADTGAVQSELRATDAQTLQFVGVDAGENYSIGWTASGEVFTWGSNERGQLGTGVEGGSRPVPERVDLPDGVQISAAAAGINTVIALSSDGGVFTWGSPNISQTTPVPTRSAFFDSLADPVVGVSSGGFFYLAWTESGALYSWGESGGGRLGRQPTSGQSPPARVTAQGIDARFVESADAGRFQGVARVDGGAATVVWGTGFNSASGVTLSGIPSSVAGVVAGTSVVLAWTQDGSLFSATTSTASLVSGISGVAGAAASFPAAGASSFYAWQPDGTLYAWGNNSQGQLGLGFTGGTVASPAPVALSPGSSALLVGGGADHALYLGVDGTFSSAGNNDFGQLGTGETAQRDTFGSAVTIVRWPE